MSVSLPNRSEVEGCATGLVSVGVLALSLAVGWFFGWGWALLIVGLACIVWGWAIITRYNRTVRRFQEILSDEDHTDEKTRQGLF